MIMAIPITQHTECIDLLLKFPIIYVILETELYATPFGDIWVSLVRDYLEEFWSEERDSEVWVSAEHLSEASLVIDAFYI